MTSLNEYLNEIVSTSPYPITYSGNHPSILNRWLVKGEPANRNGAEGVEPYCSTEGRILYTPELSILPQEVLEINWRYYLSENKTTIYQDNDPEELFTAQGDRYIYCLCNVYCTEPEDVQAFVFPYGRPMRIWVNGRLVITASVTYNTNPFIFSYRFQEGNNTILLEKASLARFKSIGINDLPFQFVLRPHKFLAGKELNSLFDSEAFEYRDNAYSIVPGRAIYPGGQEISLVVLPRWFKGMKREEINLRVSDYKDREISAFATTTSSEITLNLPGDISGVIHIRAESLENSDRYAEIHIFRGNFVEERESLLRRAQARTDCSEEVLKTMDRLVRIPDVCNHCAELGQEQLYVPMFKKYAEFEKYLDSPDGPGKKKIFDVFERYVTLFEESEVDDGFIAYSLYLPAGYGPGKKYPLVLSVQYGYAFSNLPKALKSPQSQEFDDAVVVNICGRGEFNLDYINEVGFIRIISSVVSNYNVDRDRIYLIGSCTGAVKGCGMAMRMPDLFAGIANVLGMPRLNPRNPEFDYFDNIENTMVYNLSNIEDGGFNSATVLYVLGKFKKVKNWDFYGLTHMEFDEMLNTGKLLKEVIGEKRVAFPKKIRYTTCEPMYNKSYWLKIEHIRDLRHKAAIRAEIKNKELIEIQADNIETFTLLLGTGEMEIGSKVTLCVNHVRQELYLDRFSRITVNIREDGLSIKAVSLTAERFEWEYNHIGIEEGLMGMKQVYFRRCRIIRPEGGGQTRNAFTAALFNILQNPLKEKSRPYRYDLLPEGDATPESLAQSNFVYVGDAADISAAGQELLEGADVNAGVSGIRYKGEEYPGDYFALIKCKNPYNGGRHAMFTVYNGKSIENELIDFLDAFDTNPLFYSDAVIYNKGRYYSFRERDGLGSDLNNESIS